MNPSICFCLLSKDFWYSEKGEKGSLSTTAPLASTSGLAWKWVKTSWWSLRITAPWNDHTRPELRAILSRYDTLVVALTEGKLSMIADEWKGRSKTHEKESFSWVFDRPRVLYLLRMAHNSGLVWSFQGAVIRSDQLVLTHFHANPLVVYHHDQSFFFQCYSS